MRQSTRPHPQARNIFTFDTPPVISWRSGSTNTALMRQDGFRALTATIQGATSTTTLGSRSACPVMPGRGTHDRCLGKKEGHTHRLVGAPLTAMPYGDRPLEVSSPE